MGLTNFMVNCYFGVVYAFDFFGLFHLTDGNFMDFVILGVSSGIV